MTKIILKLVCGISVVSAVTALTPENVYAESERTFRSLYAAAKELSGLPSPEVVSSLSGGQQAIACNAVAAAYRSSCYTARVTFYEATVRSKETHEQVAVRVNCVRVRYSGPAARAYPNGRNYCVGLN
ncbi:MAG: hypothetical protein COT74_08395 [Bdellovibrionales bacterium CG10_big_fil_rev_8_21_14_0_10_45_34]|nr:MAG: hypothetical protein COT74_08395 [Bdellovibrionales bacterium CG10_big_fil_rev_8_21_14_0_10_45_34]